MWFSKVKVKTPDEEAVEIFKLALKNLMAASKDLRSRNINADLYHIGLGGNKVYVRGPLECPRITRLTQDLEKF